MTRDCPMCRLPSWPPWRHRLPRPASRWATATRCYGLQRAVADYHSIGSPFSPQTAFTPQPTFAPETNTDFMSGNSTDLASHNNVPIMSPNQDAGANAQQGAFNLGFGDITLGDKTTNTATNGAGRQHRPRTTGPSSPATVRCWATATPSTTVMFGPAPAHTSTWVRATPSRTARSTPAATSSPATTAR